MDSLAAQAQPPSNAFRKATEELKLAIDTYNAEKQHGGGPSPDRVRQEAMQKNEENLIRLMHSVGDSASNTITQSYYHSKADEFTKFAGSGNDGEAFMEDLGINLRTDMKCLDSDQEKYVSIMAIWDGMLNDTKAVRSKLTKGAVIAMEKGLIVGKAAPLIPMALLLFAITFASVPLAIGGRVLWEVSIVMMNAGEFLIRKSNWVIYVGNLMLFFGCIHIVLSNEDKKKEEGEIRL